MKVKLCGTSGQALLASIGKLVGVSPLTVDQLTMAHLDVLEKAILAREGQQMS